MTIERVVGTTGEMVDIFVQDATVSTGAGFPNLVISTFSSYYHRTDMTSTSSVTLVSTGTMGTWSSGQWLQINSTFMRGWYQFCCPNGMYVNGSSVALHMYGHPSMAPVVMRYDVTRLDNQSTVVNVSRVGVSSFGLPVGVSSFGLPVGVSSMAIGVGVTTFNSRVGVSSIDQRVGVSSMNIGVAVTTFDSRVGVSSIDQRVGVSSISIAVSTGWFSGAGIVTTEAGRLSVDVSSIMGSKAVTTVAGYFPVYFDLELTRNQNSTVSFSSVNWSTLYSSVNANVGSVDISSVFGSPIITSFAGVFSVDVSSIQKGSAVTSAAGILVVGPVGVSSMAIGVGVTTFNSRVGVSSFGLAVGVSSNPIGVNITSVTGITVVGTGVSSDPWGP